MLTPFFRRNRSAALTVCIEEPDPTLAEQKALNMLLHEKTSLELDHLLAEESQSRSALNELLAGSGFAIEQIAEVETRLISLSRASMHSMRLSDRVLNGFRDVASQIEKARIGLSLLKRQAAEGMDKFENFLSLFMNMKTRYAEIRSFARIITEVADRMSLLSLNATIEGARAGIAAVAKTKALIDRAEVVADRIEKAERLVHDHMQEVLHSQESILAEIQMIASNLTKIVDRSRSGDNLLDGLILTAQRKGDLCLSVFNLLHQIKMLEAPEDERFT